MAVFNAPGNTNPGTLRYVKPTAGTPLQVTSNFTDLSGKQFQSLSIQAHPSNTGLIYILTNSTAADTANGTNVLAVLSGGQSIPFSGIALGGITPSQYWIDTDTTGSIAIPVVYGA